MLIAVAQGEVPLLLEDLAGRGCLRSIGHRVGRHDPDGDLGLQPVALDEEGDPRILEERIGHVVDRSAGRPERPGEGLSHDRSHILPGSTRITCGGVLHMSIEKDPVCGMDVDAATSELKIEHDGTTYWFCGKGCLLEFRDDPERLLDPDYQPSM